MKDCKYNRVSILFLEKKFAISIVPVTSSSTTINLPKINRQITRITPFTISLWVKILDLKYRYLFGLTIRPADITSTNEAFIGMTSENQSFGIFDSAHSNRAMVRLKRNIPMYF